MIEISRALARRLRAVFQKSVPIGTSRGQRSPLSLHGSKDGLLVRSYHVEAAVGYHRPGPCPSDEIFLPGECLDDFEGRGNDVVTQETVGPDTVRANWNEGPVPQVRDYASPGKEKPPPVPDEARKLVPVERDLFKALREASHCVARDSCRFSLGKMQLRGRKGEVVATDGKQLLLQKGFTFPWDDDVLIPTLGIFGSKDLDQHDGFFLGRTDTHLCLRIGP